MPTYSAWYSTGEYGKLWFKADSLEHAEHLIAEVLEREIEIGDLPNFVAKIKGEELEIDGLEELP